MIHIGFDKNWKPQRDGSLSPEQIHRMLYDLQDEPAWRSEAAREEDYYDSNQHDAETLKLMEENGIPIQTINKIQPAIDSIAGFEMIIRSDFVVKAEDDASIQGAIALNAKLKEAQRLTEFDDEVALAFIDAIKIGIGWYEVSRCGDPFKYRYRCEHIPWREMWWDWRARKMDLSDGRYKLRRKWFDPDTLCTFFPDFEELITYSSRGWPSGWIDAWDSNASADSSVHRGLRNAKYYEDSASLEEREWRDMDRGRIALFEIHYRVPKRVKALRFPSGRVVVFDPKSALHAEALRQGVEMIDGPTDTWRQAFYIGPHKIYDEPLDTNESHWFPIVSHRENATGRPYGRIRPMMSPQEAVNARHSRAIFDTTARKTFIDEDAVDDHEATAKEIGRVDAYVKLKADRRSEKGIEIVSNTDMTPVTIEMLRESKGDFHEATGLFPEFYGRAQKSGQSGRAIAELISQGQQVLGPIIRNYKKSRLGGGRRMLRLIYNDLKDQSDIDVPIEKGRRVVSTIKLNARRSDGKRDNDMLILRTRVELNSVPSSETYQQQNAMALSEIVKSMPPDVQPALLDLVVRAYQLKDGEEIIERITKLTGFGPEPEDPDEREALESQKREIAEIERRMKEIELLEREAAAKEKIAKAELDRAKTRKLLGADTRLTEAKTEHTLAMADKIEDDDERADVEQQRALIETGANIMRDADQPVTKGGLKTASGKKR